MDTRNAAPPAPQEVMCKRLNTLRTVEEHTGCPYCYGRARDVESGDRARFCDFEPGKDPVAFGFPEGGSHDSA